MRVESQYQDYLNYVSNPPPVNPELNQGGSSGSIRYPDLHAFSMPVPSAPPLDEEVQVLDDCSICLEKCTDSPEGDSSLASTVAKTACKHFFHDICLQKWMATNKTTCPNCRGLLETHKITHLKLDADGHPVTAAQVAIPEDDSPLFAPQQGSLVVDLAEATVNASFQALSLLGKGLFGLAKLSGKAAVAVASGAVSAFQVSEEMLLQRAHERLIRTRIEGETSSQTIKNQLEAERNYISRYYRERTAQMSGMDSTGRNAVLAEMAQFNRVLAQQSAQIEATLSKLKDIAEHRS